MAESKSTSWWVPIRDKLISAFETLAISSIASTVWNKASNSVSKLFK